MVNEQSHLQAALALLVPVPDVSGLEILDVECHSRAEHDWYAATVSVDVLVFLWVVFFYQVNIMVLPSVSTAGTSVTL
jgi:hypothetical protein